MEQLLGYFFFKKIGTIGNCFKTQNRLIKSGRKLVKIQLNNYVGMLRIVLCPLSVSERPDVYFQYSHNQICRNQRWENTLRI